MTQLATSEGQTIGGFRLERRMDPGGMAQFWQVSRPDIAFPIVMKIPLLRPGEDMLKIIGYEVEEMILPRLSGKHVPRHIASGDFEQPYIVMEFIEGPSVKSLLARTPLPAAEVAAIGAKIAHALHDIHRQHVIHHDLKPSNIILRGDKAVLIDFGLSRHDQLPDLVQEEAEGPVGTGPYVAPEEVLGDRTDPRSDLFALGVIMYFLATGERPYGEPQNMSGWRRRLWRDPVPPRARNKDIPPWLQEVILHCLEIDPDNRYATAAQLAFDLQHPEQVALTQRAERLQRDGFITTTLRRFRSRNAEPKRRPSLSAHLSSAPIVMVAIDLAPEHEALGDALATAVRRLFATETQARLACVNILKVARLALDEVTDEQGRNPQLGRLIALKHWARAIPIAADRISYHALESTDPAAAIIDYAKNNRVDHIFLGARASSSLRRFIGSVSTQVVAEAPCTVTVVRLPEQASTS